MSLLDACRLALGNANVQAFLRVIRDCEGTPDDAGYRRHFGGELFDSFDRHPGRAITKPHGGKALTSTAAGAYQFLSGTWAECQQALWLPDFSPASQDLAAVFLVRRRGALDMVIAGQFEDAISGCAKEWASLPGSPYGQPVKTMAHCKAVYERWGGKYAPAAFTEQDAEPVTPPPPEPQRMPDPPRPDQEPYVQPEARMPIPAIVAPVLPSIIEAIPKLGGLFGSGSKVAERNVKAAETVVELVRSATGAVNAQDAAERLKSDPAAVVVATKAVEAAWFDLVEGGGGGIDGARKADAEARKSGESVLSSPSFLIGLGMLPLVYMVLVSVLFGVGPDWPSDVRAAIATAVVSLIVGGLMGYYFGQTTTRNRTPQ